MESWWEVLNEANGNSSSCEDEEGGRMEEERIENGGKR